MGEGRAPIGTDGHPVELHHADQTPDGPLVEMTRTAHRLGGNYAANHKNTGRGKTKIDRKEFAKQKRAHWKERAKDADKCMDAGDKKDAADKKDQEPQNSSDAAAPPA